MKRCLLGGMAAQLRSGAAKCAMLGILAAFGAFVAGPADAVSLFGSASPGRLLTINPATNAVTQIGPTVRIYESLAFDPNGVLYGSASPGRLLIINPATNAVTQIEPAVRTYESLAFDPSGVLYGSPSGGLNRSGFGGGHFV